MRILILGAGGMLGHKLWQHLSRRYARQTYATLRGARDESAYGGLFAGANVIDRVDALDRAALERVLDTIRPEVVINCIAVTKRREGAADALASIELNAALPHRLCAWGAAHGARIVHFSTDCVFDGRRGGYTEDSPTDAEDLYGRTKALGEIAAAGALTLRTSFIGRELSAKTELLEWFLAQRGKRIQGYRRALYTGVSTLWMAQLIGDLLARPAALSGVYQVAAPPISKFDLLVLARKAYNLAVEIEPADRIVIRRDLDGSRFSRATGIVVPAWEDMMTALAADPTPYDAWSASDAA